jgi:hypothetical protein
MNVKKASFPTAKPTLRFIWCGAADKKKLYPCNFLHHRPPDLMDTRQFFSLLADNLHLVPVQKVQNKILTVVFF